MLDEGGGEFMKINIYYAWYGVDGNDDTDDDENHKYTLQATVESVTVE